MNHLISFLLAFLLSLLLLSPAWSQRDCGNQLDCFLQAVQSGEAVEGAFQSDQFFLPTKAPVQQKWTYSPDQNTFTLAYANNIASEGIIKHGIRTDRRRGRSNDVRVQFDILKETYGQVPATIQCPCEAETAFLDYLRAWSLGSYSIYDLERLQCTWFLQKNEENTVPVPLTMAPVRDVKLVTVNVKKEARLAPMGKAYYPEGTSVLVEVEFEGESPIDINRYQSTLEYFRAGDQSLLTEEVEEKSTALLDQLELYSLDEAAVEKPRENRYFQLIKNDSIHQVRIRTPQLPAAGNKHLSLAGKLAFDFPAEEQKVLSRSLSSADLPYQQWYAPGFYVEIRRDDTNGQLRFHLVDRKWSIFERILITDGEQEWTFTPQNILSYHHLDTSAEELQVTIYYREREVRYVPFEFAVGMDL